MTEFRQSKSRESGSPEQLEGGAGFSAKGLTVLFVVATLAASVAFYSMVHEQDRRPGLAGTGGRGPLRRWAAGIC